MQSWTANCNVLEKRDGKRNLEGPPEWNLQQFARTRDSIYATNEEGQTFVFKVLNRKT